MIIEVMKAIIGLNEELYKNVPKPEFSAAEFLKKIKTAASLSTIENLGRAEIEEVPIEDAEEVVETQVV